MLDKLNTMTIYEVDEDMKIPILKKAKVDNLNTFNVIMCALDFTIEV